MKRRAFTLTEQIIVLIVIGIIASAVTTVIKPTEINNEAIKKSGKSLFVQIEFATTQMVARMYRGRCA